MVFVYGFGDHGDVVLTEDMPPGQGIPAPWLRPPVDALLSEESQITEAFVDTKLGHSARRAVCRRGLVRYHAQSIEPESKTRAVLGAAVSDLPGRNNARCSNGRWSGENTKTG